MWPVPALEMEMWLTHVELRVWGVEGWERKGGGVEGRGSGGGCVGMCGCGGENISSLHRPPKQIKALANVSQTLSDQ